MTEAYEIGISLALENGISAGIASIRRDLAALDQAVDASAKRLATLTRAAGAAAGAAPVPVARPNAPAPVKAEVAAAVVEVATRVSQTRPASIAPSSTEAPATVARAEAAPATPSPVAAAPSVAPRASEARPVEAGRLDAAVPKQIVAVPAPSAAAPVLPPVKDIAAVPVHLARAEDARATPAAPVASVVRETQSLLQAPAQETPSRAQAPVRESAAAPIAPVSVAAPDLGAIARAMTGRAPLPPGEAPRAPPVRIVSPTPAAAGGTEHAAPVVQHVARVVRSEPAQAPERQFATPSVAPAAVTRTRERAEAAQSSAERGAAAPASVAATPAGPTGGDVYLDGARMGRWLADHMAREAARPPTGGTGFDARQSPAWSTTGGY